MRWSQRLGDSIASLVPRADGMFEARLHLSESFAGMSGWVSDSVGKEVDTDWLILSGTRDGKPSLASMLAALWVTSYGYEPEEVRRPREAINVSDSLRRYFPDYPAGWINSRSDRSASAIERLIAYFQTGERRHRYGDSATGARWRDRALGTGLRYWDSTYATNRSLRLAAERNWRDALRTSCVLPAGKFPMSTMFGSWWSICERNRTFGFTFLARARLLDGDPHSARAFADSALMPRSGTPAFGRWYSTYLAAARTDLALGDTQTAFGHLVTVASFWPDRSVIRDSARVFLGPRFHQTEFDLAADSARRIYVVCAERERAAAKAREDRLRNELR